MPLIPPATSVPVWKPPGKPVCACCTKCEWDARMPGRCPYGGPFAGYKNPDGLPITLPDPPSEEPSA
jgi:hypothetical protein